VYGYRNKSNKVSDEYELNQDVKKENEIILNMNENVISDYNLVVRNLVKYYEDKKIVKHVCFKSKKNECLVILGSNGAGKTTTFKMLTGEVSPNYGDV